MYALFPKMKITMQDLSKNLIGIEFNYRTNQDGCVKSLVARH